MSESVKTLKKELANDLDEVRKNLTLESIKKFKAKYLGKSGSISQIMRAMG
jgi:hypothetical protein